MKNTCYEVLQTSSFRECQVFGGEGTACSKPSASFLYFTALSPFPACMLSTRLTTEGTVDDQTKVTDGGSFGDGAGDNGTTSFKGDVEQGKIGFCEWRDGMQSRIILRLHFLGCTVQVMGDKELYTNWRPRQCTACIRVCQRVVFYNVAMFWTRCA